MAEITWIKLSLDMFDNKKIKQIRKMPGGNDMVLFWVMLLSLAGKANCQGYILFTENIAYTPEMLANECDIPLSTVKIALDLFTRFNMIAIENEIITVTGWSEYQNVEGMERAKMLAAERVKRHREKKKMLLQSAQEETCAGGDSSYVTLHDTLQQPLRNLSETHIEREEIENKEIRDIEKEREEHKSLINDALEVCKYFESITCGKSVSQFLNEIKMLVEMYSKPWVLEAVDISVSKHVYSLAYVRTILKNWAKEGKVKNDVKQIANEPVKTAAYKPFEFED